MPLTNEQEKILKELKTLMKKGRKLQMEYGDISQKIFSLLYELHIDPLYIETSNGVDADGLSECITCYMDYGDGNLNEIIKVVEYLLLDGEIEKPVYLSDEL